MDVRGRGMPIASGASRRRGRRSPGNTDSGCRRRPRPTAPRPAPAHPTMRGRSRFLVDVAAAAPSGPVPAFMTASTRPGTGSLRAARRIPSPASSRSARPPLESGWTRGTKRSSPDPGVHPAPVERQGARRLPERRVQALCPDGATGEGHVGHASLADGSRQPRHQQVRREPRGGLRPVRHQDRRPSVVAPLATPIICSSRSSPCRASGSPSVTRSRCAP